MLPLTTRVAPRSRNAVLGSSTLRRRTTLDGTTHNDDLPAPRLESSAVKLSINPSASAALAGSFPILSKGSTAMCFSSTPLISAARSRTAGISKEAAATSNSSPAAAARYHQRNLDAAATAAADPDWLQVGCEAFFTASAKSCECDRLGDLYVTRAPAAARQFRRAAAPNPPASLHNWDSAARDPWPTHDK